MLQPELSSSPDVAVSLDGVPVINAVDPTDLCAVVDQLEPMIRERAAKGPVVVITSEMHHVATHVALAQAIMARFTDGPTPLKVAHGIEWPHNLYQEIMESEFGRSLSPELRHTIETAGSEEQRLLRAFRETVNPPGAPITRRNVLEFASRRNISVRTLDAARKPGWNGIDVNERLTRDFIEKYSSPILQLVPESPAAYTEEIRLRNNMAMDFVEAHIRESGAQIYVLSYGSGHLFGMRERVNGYLHPYKDSLHALFTARGIDAMPVFMEVESSSKWEAARFPGAHIIPPEAGPGLRRGVLVTGLSDEIFHNEQSDFPEMFFLEELSRRSCGVLELFSDPGIRAPFPHWTYVKTQDAKPRCSAGGRPVNPGLVPG